MKLDQIDNYYKTQSETNSTQHKSSAQSLRQLFQIPGMLFVTLSIYFCWACNGLISYSITLNSAQLGSNIYINFAMLSLSSTICTTCLFFTIERWNRKRIAGFAYTIMAICGLTLSYLFAYHPKSEARLIVSMIFSFCSSGVYHVIMLLSSETFPTVIRQFGVGSCSVASRFGSITAPFTKDFVSQFHLDYLVNYN
jgi:MFS family permease